MIVLWLWLGGMIGSALSIATMSVLQIHRVNKYEEEIKRLKEKLNQM